MYFLMTKAMIHGRAANAINSMFCVTKVFMTELLTSVKPLAFDSIEVQLCYMHNVAFAYALCGLH